MQRPLIIGCCSGAAVMTAKLWAGRDSGNSCGSYGGIMEVAFTPWAMILGAVPAGITIGVVYMCAPEVFSSDITSACLGICSSLLLSNFHNMI